MGKLSEAIYPGISKLAAAGSLLIPKQISWRRAKRIQAAGAGTIYPFHERWLGRIDITPAGRAALASRVKVD